MLGKMFGKISGNISGKGKRGMETEDKHIDGKKTVKEGGTQNSRVLIQHVKELSEYLREKNISKKAVALAAAVLMLAGLMGIKYSEDGTLLPTSSAAGGKELPIYCVQTEEPQIALTFDAACADGCLR